MHPNLVGGELGAFLGDVRIFYPAHCDFSTANFLIKVINFLFKATEVGACQSSFGCQVFYPTRELGEGTSGICDVLEVVGCGVAYRYRVDGLKIPSFSRAVNGRR